MIILDTHVLIWWAEGEIERLSATQVDAIQEGIRQRQVKVSAISLWELGMLVHRGRLSLSQPVSVWWTRVRESYGISAIPLDGSVLLDSVNLPGDFHADPADRMIVATTRVHEARLVTLDQKTLNYPHVKLVR